ncbi:MAG: hypothetical protein OER95_11410, partial [Acidimicrobiia bacterium]|nr:hypothetical protein [Acidimicrobiia bacterium]
MMPARPDATPFNIAPVAGDRFDRDEVSAIIRRAAEVSDWDRTGDDRLGLDDLMSVAEEVGLSPSAVVTALAEARAGVDHRRNLVDRFVGPGQVWAIGRLPAGSDRSVDGLRHWLEVDHGLRTFVRSDGVVVAEPKSGFLGAVSSGIRKLGGTGGLERSRRVSGAIATVGDDGSLCVVADVGNKQLEAMLGGTLIAGGAGAVVAVVAVVTTPLALLGLPVTVATGVLTARMIHRHNLHAVAGQIEMTTEAVLRG